MHNKINKFIIEKVKNVIYVDFQRFREESDKIEEIKKGIVEKFNKNQIVIDHKNKIINLFYK